MDNNIAEDLFQSNSLDELQCKTIYVAVLNSGFQLILISTVNFFTK